mmetsp:Transcript_4104/g.9242  ORF Transcript_4104/g.9242 Transcript_4104/m.9242 type:complete len:139 (-) Transcript_4104:30-446(-)
MRYSLDQSSFVQEHPHAFFSISRSSRNNFRRKELPSFTRMIDGPERDHPDHNFQQSPLLSFTSSSPSPSPTPPKVGVKTGARGRVQWKFGGRTCYGTLLPSKETKTHCYARTHKGNVKTLAKGKDYWSIVIAAMAAVE